MNVMHNGRVPRGVAAVGVLLLLAWAALPPSAHAVFNVGGQFQVGGQLRAITPTNLPVLPGETFADPSCDSQGGTSLAIVQGSKLAGVDPLLYPVVLVVSCLDNSDAVKRARLNFLNPADGKVVKQVSTTPTPGGGWPHFVHRPDKGDLLGCGSDGTLYSIDYSQFTATADGTATVVPRPAGLPASCIGLTWDPEEDMIYQAFSGGPGIVEIRRFKDATVTVPPDYNTPCAPSGLAITGGVLVVACAGESTVLRLDKNTGATLGVNGTLGVLGLAAGTNFSPSLGDIACDPVTFQKDPAGKDQFTDALWSRRGDRGNGVVALEFPAFTCGLPSSATSLAAGLSAPSGGSAGAVPQAACFDASGKVKDSDDDGLPDCWEDATLWAADADGVQRPGIDFNGDGFRDFSLCVVADTNGDGVPDTEECADKNHRDLYVELDYMQNRKPDPLALSQPASVTSVQSVRAAFAAAPVGNALPDTTTGIRIHLQVDPLPVTFFNLADPPASKTSVTELVFTPCTPPAVNPNGTLNVASLADAADFDAIKKLNFGTAAERDNADLNAANRLNAKRLAFRYVLFASKQNGTGGGGSNGSGCSEVGGDDAAITLGSFLNTTDQQAGTFLHEFGHLLGFRHGGGDNINCKPNYLSVMSYSRQFAGSPIPSRRLDYSRAEHPVLVDLSKTGHLNEASLDELVGLGFDPSLGLLPPFFPAVDQTAYGPSAWSVVPATGVSGNEPKINWNRNKFTSGPNKGNPIFDATAVSANLNQGSGGCDGSGTLQAGHDDWGNVQYRASAALDFAGGAQTRPTPQEHASITKEQADAFFEDADLDVNGVGDARDCGTFPDGSTFLCTHRIDVKPSFTVPKILSLGSEATVSIAIFSEVSTSPTQVWDANQVQKNVTLMLSMESVVLPVKTNRNGEGTCSLRDVADPKTGLKDGFKDLICQFATAGLPFGIHDAVVSGFFFDPNSGEIRGFRARQEVTILP